MNTTTAFLGKSSRFRSLLTWSAPNSRHRPTVVLGAPVIAEPIGTPRKKILIVDDDAIILKTTSMKLQSRGYEAITAADGTKAILAVRKEKPDLILLDISFPADAGGTAISWDGFLIMSWLQRFEEARNIPIIVISGGDPVQYKERSLASGATAFFQKPLDHKDLLSVIEQTLVPGRPSAESGFDTSFQI